MSCELWIAGKRYNGFVKDVSEIGLYLQTRAKAAPGTQVVVVFPAEGSRREVSVMARVARTDRLKAHFATQGAGGLGIQVVDAGHGLGPLLADAGFASDALTPAGAGGKTGGARGG